MSHASRERKGRRIATKYSAGATCRPQLEALEERDMPSVFSTIDQVGNNTSNPTLGTVNTALLRLSPEAYRTAANDPNGFFTPSMNGGAPFFVAGSRLVSNVVSNQATVLFGDTDFNTINSNGLSNFAYTFGQFLDHDMSLTPDTPVNDFPIPADPTHPDDPLSVDAATSLRMGRSVFDPNTGTTNAREQINVNTSFLDLSQVYGSTMAASNALRTFSGGKLKTSAGADGTVGTQDDLLPFNNLAYFTQPQLDALRMANDARLVPAGELFAAGDVRANETTELTALQTLFVRNHNRIAGQLAASHADWDDERLFQEARRLNVAQYQIITYTQYLPALLGPNALEAYAGYDATVDPSISNEFSTVAFRFGHSLLNNDVLRLDNAGNSLGAISLQDSFFNTRLLTLGVVDPLTGLTATDIDAILKGDAVGRAQEMDVFAVSSIRNLLFNAQGAGEDLIARDLWRAHDHGIGTYNQLRVAFGLAPITDTGGGTVYVPGQPFHGFEQISSDPEVVARLVQAYTGPTREAFLANGKFAGDIDPFMAGLAEDHVLGSNLGPLFQAILVDQFTRLRDGDRFFYLTQTFNAEEQAIIGQGDTLAKVIMGNTGVTGLQADVFLAPSLTTGDSEGVGHMVNAAGRLALTGSATGTTLTDAVFDRLVASLANPDQAGKLVLVDAQGNYLDAAYLRSFANLQSYLSRPGSNNMAHTLSVQLLITELHVLLGLVDTATNVYVPASEDLAESAALRTSLAANGVSTTSGVANIGTALAAAKDMLRTRPLTTTAGADRTFEQALATLFRAINGNEAFFIG